MSRIGKLPITVPGGVDVKIDGQLVTVKGPKGELSLAVAEPIRVALEEGQVLVTRPDDERNSRALHGLTRTLINNNIIGVTEGYSKQLEVVGTGYRVQQKGAGLERRCRRHGVTLAVVDQLHEDVAGRAVDDETRTRLGADDLLAKAGVTTRAGVRL